MKRLLMAPHEVAAQVREEQQRLRSAYELRQAAVVGYDEANRRAPAFDMSGGPTLEELKPCEQLCPTLSDLLPLIDWRMLLWFWGFRGETLQQMLVNPEAVRLLDSAKTFLQQIDKEQGYRLGTLLRFKPASRRGNDIIVDGRTVLPMLRCQQTDGTFVSLCDYFPTEGERPLGLFCVSCRPLHPQTEAPQSMEWLMRHALCARLAEAAVAWLFRRSFANGVGAIRPAFGYPSCPDHTLKRVAFDILGAEELLDVQLTDSYAIDPATSACGLFIAHPQARYFAVGRIDEAQFRDYCQRRGLSEADGSKYLSTNYIQ